MLLPVPITAPPHELADHSAMAPVPALPPTSVRIVLPPLHIVEMPEILLGAVESVLTLMSCEAQAVTLQVPLYLTK